MTAAPTANPSADNSGSERLPQLKMRRLSLEDLPPVETPHGYVLRDAVPEDEPALAALQATAFDDAGWTVERVQKALTQAADVVRVFVLAADDGTLVATASVQMPPGETRTGFVHWVGADPARKGKRFGYWASLAVLHELKARGCSAAALFTDDFRLPAIKTYLNLGFLPLVTHESHPERWRKVAAGLGIPPLGLLHETVA
jgi:mycothiol synthase